MLSDATKRKYIFITVRLNKGVQVKAGVASIFGKFLQTLFEEFKTKNLFISKSKIEGIEGEEVILFVGIFCQSASKHTFLKKLKESLSSSEYTIEKIESKKGVGPLSFELLGKDKELILSFGEDLSFFQKSASAFQQHRAVTPILEKPKKRASARKTTNRTETPLPEAHHFNLSVVRLVNKISYFLFIFAPRLFCRRLLNGVALLWVGLILALVFALFFSDIITIDIKIAEGAAEKIKTINDFMERFHLPLRIPVPSPPPPISLPLYHYRRYQKVGEFFSAVFIRAFEAFSKKKCEELFEKAWNFFFGDR